MTNYYTNKNIYKKIKIIFYIFLFLYLIIFASFYFLTYKIKKESELIALIKKQSTMKRDLHILCMLDYMINPNGKSILKDCKKIDLNQTKIDTPYLDFYFKYLQ